MKIGFELESFCLDADGKPVLVPDGVPLDECGWLAEVRSEPHMTVGKAVSLLEAERRYVDGLAKAKNVTLSYVPLLEISRDLKVQAARRNGKGILSYLNVYGYETHRNAANLATASLHVSFTEERTFHYSERSACKECHYTEQKSFKYQGFIDHARIIVGLDLAFKDEIRKAKRNPGFYEIKSDGRIEYRSLPNDVDLNKVADVLVKILKDVR